MIIYGKNSCKEAILANRTVYIGYIDNKFNDKAILNLLDEYKIKTKRLAKDKLNQMTNNAVHQGVVLEVEDYKKYTIEDFLAKDPKNALILDRIEDPHNFGAIIRTAEAAGIEDIIIAERGQADMTSAVAKIASGALEYVCIYVVPNLAITTLKLKENNYLIIGSSLEGESWDSIPEEGKKILIIGNEGEGMSHLLKRNSDVLIKIPMFGKTNSLNASVAAALLIYKLKNSI